MIRALGIILIVVGFAVLPATASAASTTASCPTQSFLQYAGVVYASEAIPASVQLTPGRQLGPGEIDRPKDPSNPCAREHRNIEVVAIEGVDPGTAILVQGTTSGTGFILGGRCSGITSAAERWSCVLSPLSYGSIAYTGVRYPATPAPQGTLTLGGALGNGTLGGESVAVRAIQGVDPSLAVAVDGRPSEAFLAPGVCPYERFANTPATDDLARCLHGPMWFTFSPVGGKPGEKAVATGDRAASAQLAGASVGLVLITAQTDALPAQLGATVPIGTIPSGVGGLVSLPFEIPDVPEGIYETVIRCPGCATQFAGKTTFPGGSILILKKTGSSNAKVVYIVLFALLFGLIGAAVVLWRRGYKLGRRRSQE